MIGRIKVDKDCNPQDALHGPIIRMHPAFQPTIARNLSMRINPKLIYHNWLHAKMFFLISRTFQMNIENSALQNQRLLVLDEELLCLPNDFWPNSVTYHNGSAVYSWSLWSLRFLRFRFLCHGEVITARNFPAISGKMMCAFIQWRILAWTYCVKLIQLINCLNHK